MDFSFLLKRRFFPPVPPGDPRGPEEAIEHLHPVQAHKDQIVRAVRLSQVTIVTAETGAGKSSQIPQYLAEAGFKVHVSQPRRFAAESLGSFMEFETGTRDGQRVAVKHALASKSGPNPDITIYTDGYLLQRVLKNWKSFGPNDVIIVDEAHEANLNIEAFYAVLKKRLSWPNAPKVMFMSATMDAEGAAGHFSTAVPVIHVEGRRKTVTDLPRGASMVDDIGAQVALDRNVLVFLPGKEEIRKLAGKLAEAGVDAEILPLHSKLSAQEQARVHGKYDRPKVVLATNIAQTSVTIDDLDVVISSGFERRIMIERGIEVLALVPISRPDLLQQKGRVGRTKEGYCINWGHPYEELSPEPAWPIQNSNLDSLMLRLSAGGEEMESLHFLHEPSRAAKSRAKASLKRLGLIGPEGHVTRSGRAVASLPLDVRTGKMVAMAAQYRDTQPEVLQAAVTVAAIVETDGILEPSAKRPWWPLVKPVAHLARQSDLFTQLEVFSIASQWDPETRAMQFHRFGISEISFKRAEEMRQMLSRRLKLPLEPVAAGDLSSFAARTVLECIWTGWMDSVFKIAGRRGTEPMYKPAYDKKGHHRRLSHSSSVKTARLVVGTPFDIEGDEDETVRLLTMATSVDPVFFEKHRASFDKNLVHDMLKKFRAEERNSHHRSRGVRGSRNIGNNTRLG